MRIEKLFGEREKIKIKFFISSLSCSNNGMSIEFKSRFNLCEFS
jgi:hypothetical protein